MAGPGQKRQRKQSLFPLITHTACCPERQCGGNEEVVNTHRHTQHTQTRIFYNHSVSHVSHSAHRSHICMIPTWAYSPLMRSQCLCCKPSWPWVLKPWASGPHVPEGAQLWSLGARTLCDSGPASLILIFLVFKMGMTMPASKGCREDWMRSPCMQSSWAGVGAGTIY